MALISMFIDATGFVVESRVKRDKTKTDIFIRPTQKVCDFIEANKEVASLFNPVHLPMVVPPLDWT